MAITVVCRKCRARFSVSERFAGQSGPCPKCKAPIKVPTTQEEVKVHGGEDFSSGGRNAAGQLVLKPVAREQTKIEPVQAVAIGGATLAVLLVTWFGGNVLARSTVACAVGLLLVSPPLALAAYTFLRDLDREPYRGVELMVRVAGCALAYVVLWAVFAYLAGTVLTGELWEWLFVVPPFLAIGGAMPMLALDLDYGDGVFHYIFYMLVTLALRWVAGMPWPWS